MKTSFLQLGNEEDFPNYDTISVFNKGKMGKFIYLKFLKI